VKVVLVNPPIRLPGAFAHYPMFSTLGLLTNAAWLRAQGIDVAVVDAFTTTPRLNIRMDGEEGFRHIGVELDVLVERVVEAVGDASEDACVVVAVTMFSDMNRPQENLVPPTVAAIAEALPDANLGLADLYTCGMNYFPFDPLRALDAMPGADWILLGEAEPTLPALVRRLEANEAISALPRLARRDGDGALEYNAKAPDPIDDLDHLPLPAFDLLDMDSYFTVLADAIDADLVHEYHVVERQLPLMTSRSCPFRCNFCTNQVLGLPWRAHSVDYLRETVRELRDRYQVDRFLLLDDNINVDRDRFRELVRMLADEGVAWDAVNGYRADRLDREMVRAIKAAGNTKITVSAESGDPKLLKKVIKKGLKLSAVIELAKICMEERIPLQVHYILGVPGESKVQLNKTLEFATELFARHGAWPLLQHAIPFPGTRLYAQCEEEGWFIAPPEEISGAVLEVDSIIRTPELEPGDVIDMKHAAQHLHAAMQSLVMLEVETECDCDCVACHCTKTHGHEDERGRTGTNRDTGTDTDSARSQNKVSRSGLRAAMERARFLGGRELFLSGGEPTLREDLSEIALEARELGFERIGLVTNAHGLTNEKRAKRLLDAGIDRFVVDLFGPSAEVHDAVARRKGAFKFTLGGIRQVMKLGCSEIEANLPITTINLESLAATVALAQRLGIRRAHLQLPQPDGPALEEGCIPAWKVAEPHLVRALAAASRDFVSIQGAPLCLWPDRPGALAPLPHWALARARPYRVKHDLCRKCVMYLLCGGFFRPELDEVYQMTTEP